MKEIALFACLLFGCLEGSPQPAKHVVLISIDGFRPEFYLDDSWHTPNLQRLKNSGVYARAVASVFPSVTYPSHTTLVTGALPGRHGIYYNAPYGAQKGQWYWEESFIKVPTLWDAVKAAGMTSGAVMWPVTVGAPINYNFPVRRADNDEKADQLAVTLPFVTPKGLVQEMEKKSIGKLTTADFNTDNTIDITIGKMASYIISTYRPNLMALHFVTADHMQHEHGRDAPEVKTSVAMIDSMVGVVLKSISDAGLASSTTVIVTGDHGFVNTTHSFSPNVLLAQRGIITESDTLARFLGTGGSAFLYLKNKNDQATLAKVNAILHGLPADQEKLFRIVDRSELDRVGANPEVAMGLALANSIVANSDAKGAVVKAKGGGGSHGYYPDMGQSATGFIAAGRGIGKHREITGMGIKDVAPVIASLLGLLFNSPDGVVIPGILPVK